MDAELTNYHLVIYRNILNSAQTIVASMCKVGMEYNNHVCRQDLQL